MAVHLGRIRPYQNRELFNTMFTNTTQTTCKDTTTGRTTRPAHTQPTQDHEWFAVDILFKSKLVNGRKYYLILWKGKFPNSWEADDHINDYSKQQFNIRRTQQGTLRKQFKRTRAN